MDVNETEFYNAVERRASLDSPEAAREATAATVRTLGERLSDGEVDDIAPLLPEGVASALVDAAGGGSGDFSFDEFVERVADRTGANDADAQRQARAVGATLADAIANEELDDARSQLPPTFDQLFWAVDYDAFIDLVQRGKAVGSDSEASEAAVVTLEVLGERLSSGQAADIAEYLPPAFGGSLRSAGTPATDLSADEFVERVADRARVEPDVAQRYVQAVTAALAEAVPNYEYRNLLDQLPDEYAPLLGAIVHRDRRDT